MGAKEGIDAGERIRRAYHQSLAAGASLVITWDDREGLLRLDVCFVGRRGYVTYIDPRDVFVGAGVPPEEWPAPYKEIDDVAADW